MQAEVCPGAPLNMTLPLIYNSPRSISPSPVAITATTPKNIVPTVQTNTDTAVSGDTCLSGTPKLTDNYPPSSHNSSQTTASIVCYSNVFTQSGPSEEVSCQTRLRRKRCGTSSEAKPAKKAKGCA